jgi:hypothetical protein
MHGQYVNVHSRLLHGEATVQELFERTLPIYGSH